MAGVTNQLIPLLNQSIQFTQLNKESVLKSIYGVIGASIERHINYLLNTNSS